MGLILERKFCFDVNGGLAQPEWSPCICLTFDEDEGVRPESLMWPLMFSDGLGLLNRFKRAFVDTLTKDLYYAFHQQCKWEFQTYGLHSSCPDISNALICTSLAGLADKAPAGVEETELNPKSGLRSLLFPPPTPLPPGGPGAAAEGRFSDIILALRSSVMVADAAKRDS